MPSILRVRRILFLSSLNGWSRKRPHPFFTLLANNECNGESALSHKRRRKGGKREVASQLAPHFHCDDDQREEGREETFGPVIISIIVGPNNYARDRAQSLGFVKMILSTLYTH